MYVVQHSIKNPPCIFSHLTSFFLDKDDRDGMPVSCAIKKKICFQLQPIMLISYYKSVRNGPPITYLETQKVWLFAFFYTFIDCKKCDVDQGEVGVGPRPRIRTLLWMCHNVFWMFTWQA